MFNLKRLLKVSILLFIGLVVASSYFIYQTLEAVDLNEMRRVSAGEAFRHREQSVESELEEGATINKQELESFLLMTHGINVKSIKDIPLNGRTLVEDTKLPKLLINDCSHIYCFQHRIKFESIPSIFWKGLIGIEDRRFLDHFGVDIKSIIRAVIIDLKEMKLVQGGSTLTQQLVKNIFYTNEKTLIRKLKEIIVAVYIERKFEKEQIIESYFNEVFWGSVQSIRVKGIYAASLFYFGKKIEEIRPYEAAILISMLKGPNYYSPYRKDITRLKARVNTVYKKLVEMNLFPKSSEDRWYEGDWTKWVDSLRNRNKKKNLSTLWRVIESKPSNFSDYESYTFNSKGNEVLRLVKKKYPKVDFALKGIIGNFKKTENFKYYSKWERDKSKAIDKEFHAIGSTIKPIIYQALMKLGLSLEDKVETAKVTLKLKSGFWSPKDSHKAHEDMVTVKEALQKSMNRPLIRLSEILGFEKIEGILKTQIPRLKTPLSEYPAQLLGAVELSLSELFQLYKEFIVRECVENNQSILMALSDPNQTTIRRLVGSDIGQMNFFGKTGTTNKGLDNWFVWFDGTQFGALWLGVESSRDIKSLGLYGGTTSFRVLQAFFQDRGKRFSELGCHFVSGDI